MLEKDIYASDTHPVSNSLFDDYVPFCDSSIELEEVFSCMGLDYYQDVLPEVNGWEG